MKDANDAHESVQLAVRHETVALYVVDKEAEKKVVRKIDRVILPLMAFIYFFQCTYRLAWHVLYFNAATTEPPTCLMRLTL
jgi:hypothetical protein